MRHRRLQSAGERVMLETLNNLILRIADPLFGWLLLLPKDAALFSVALMTSGLLTVVRLWVTDQEWLARAAADRKRLKALIRDAKRNRDREAVKRHKATVVQIQMRSLKFELKPLLIALLPIVLLATWCFARLGFHPPRDGEPITVRLFVSRALIDRLVHMIPEDGIEADSGWVRKVEPDKLPEPADAWERINQAAMVKLCMFPPLEGVAEWRIRAKARPQPYELAFVVNGREYTKELVVGRRTYAPDVDIYAGDTQVAAIQTVLRPVKLFGMVPGIPILLNTPPWLVAYLLIVIPFVPIIKRVFHIF